MRRTTLTLLIFALIGTSTQAQTPIPVGAQCLIESYPDVVCGFEDNMLVYCDQSTAVWDDGKTKDAERAIESADIEDQFRYRYRVGPTETPPKHLEDPGRIRNDAMFQKIYGGNKKSVGKTVVEIPWFRKKVKLTTRYDVAQRLKTIEAEVKKLPKPIRQRVEVPSGGFVWRTIKGTKRRSAHSYAIAVDVGVKFSDYWKWSKPKNGRYVFKNRIPLEVVEIFEKHGFIWGGKWYHFDTMHFEYRPELICAGSQ